MAEINWQEVVPDTDLEDNRHDFEKEDTLEGVYFKKLEKADKYDRDHYLIRTSSGEEKKVFSSTVLKKRFDKIEIGSNVKIEFMGLKPSGQGQDYKDFKVYVVKDDDVPINND